MGLADRFGGKVEKVIKNNPIRKIDNNPINITPDEVSWIISKLRQSNYTGNEFETFYNVMRKLQDLAQR